MSFDIYFLCYEESRLIETKYEVISEIPKNILINRQRPGVLFGGKAGNYWDQSGLSLQ